MENMCRVCLTSGDQLNCKLTEESDVLHKLRSCVNIQINISDNHPQHLCEKCFNKIQDFNQFREQIIINENKITEMIKNNTLTLAKKTETPIKIEIDLKVESPLNDQRSDYEDYTTDSEIKNETSKVEKNKKNKKLRKTLSKRVVEFQDGGQTHDPLKCLMCFKTLDTQEALIKHYKSEHSLAKEFAKEEFNGDKNMDMSDKYLVLNSDNVARYKCNSCGDIFKSKEDILEHIKDHIRERPYVCRLCGRTYMTIYAMVLHGRVHGGFKQYCSFGCGYSSPHGGALRDHERRHSNEHSYKCKECGKGFMVKTWYEQHQNIHNNVKPFICDFCGMAFHMHRYLMAHRNKIHPDLSAIRRFMCVQCNFTCETKMRLNTHVKLEHKKAEDPVSIHLCDICGKTFSRVESLTNHKKVHNGITPFICALCNKSFSKKYNLQVHMTVHETESKNKPQCNTCGKFFAQKSSLHRHIRRRHSNEVYIASKCKI